MAPSELPGEPADRMRRSDGAQTRERLLLSALRLFAEKGYERTSTREFAHSAHANVGAIAYYFGDKQGLYRAAFTEVTGNPRDDIAAFADPALSLHQALLAVYRGFAEPFELGELPRLCTRLHLREMIEPTGAWQTHIQMDLRPYHQALTEVLRRHLGLPRPDDDLYRLAFAIVSLGVYLYVGQDLIDDLCPSLMADAPAIHRWAERMAEHALAMVQAEARRRGLPLPTDNP